MRQATMRQVVLLAGVVAVGAIGRPARAQAPGGGLNDPTIVAIFDAANTWDIQTGALAAKKGTTKEVRAFGAMLVRDHTKVRQMGRDLATKLAVTPTPPKDFAMAADHAGAMKTLRAAQGKAFDRAFLEHEVTFHRAVIDALNGTFLPAIQNAQLKALVQEVVPAFDAHLKAAQRLLDEQGK